MKINPKDFPIQEVASYPFRMSSEERRNQTTFPFPFMGFYGRVLFNAFSLSSSNLDVAMTIKRFKESESLLYKEERL